MEFSPKKSRETHCQCCVSTCKVRASDKRKLSFHRFLKFGRNSVMYQNKKNYLFDAWLNILQLKNIEKNTVVCSLHFTKDDYNFADISSGCGKRYLKRMALPSLNLPTKSISPPAASTSKFIVIETAETKVHRCLESELQPDKIILEDKEICDISDIGVASLYENKASQVTSGDLISPFSDLITSDRELFTMCGIPSTQILNEITNMVNEYYPDVRRHKLNLRDRIILVTLKLKLDLSFSVITILFKHVSVWTCRQTFYDLLPKLSNILRAATMWVPKNEIKNNVPVHFINFRDTMLIVDCTEIKIQKIKCLKCRIKFYAQYKSDFTVKFMVGVTPAGIISIVSEPYGGRDSDKAIFEQSNVISLMEKYDSIMVDKGFMIDSICDKYEIKLIRPPHLRNKKQLSEEEAILNREIASARVHVERMNERIKVFDILNNRLEWRLVSYIDDIFAVCCGLANLSSPILADDKFIL